MSTPRWQRLAEAGYALALHLYPRRIRERHGEEMQQAFRDRCREVAQGRLSILRLFGAELGPDLAGSLATAHFEDPFMPRKRIALSAFALLACAWLFHDAFSKRLLDAYFWTGLRVEHWREDRALARDEGQVRALASTLAASPRDSERSLAAYLLQLNDANRRFTGTYFIGTPERLAFAPDAADAAQASKLLASLSQTKDVQAARIAMATCRLSLDCDRFAHAQALVRVDPGNAFGWAQAFKAHSMAGNEAAARADLHRLASARFYEDGMRAAWSAAWFLANHSSGGAASFGALGRQLTGENAIVDRAYMHSLAYRCLLPWPGTPDTAPRLSQDPATRADCRRAALLFASSSNPNVSMWGREWLWRENPSPQTQAGVEAATQQISSYGGTFEGGRYWRAWTDAEWMAWARSQKAFR